MQLVAPDILQDACCLSATLIIAALVLGLALWLFGWSYHRFWIVLITTVLAGIFGLYEGPEFRAQPIVAAVLLALAGGILALAMVRLLAFLAGGMTGLMTVQALVPSLDQPLVCFVVCGLIGLLLFRFSMMALTSLAGTLLMGYGALALLNHYGTMDAVGWTTQGAVLLNWICGLIALLGFGVQYLLDRRARRADKDEDDDAEKGTFDFLLGRGTRWGWGFRKAS